MTPTCDVCQGPVTEDDRMTVFETPTVRCYVCKSCGTKALEGWKRANLGTDAPTLHSELNRMYERNTYKHLRKGDPNA